jgi:hypothetical protein
VNILINNSLPFILMMLSLSTPFPNESPSDSALVIRVGLNMIFLAVFGSLILTCDSVISPASLRRHKLDILMGKERKPLDIPAIKRIIAGYNEAIKSSTSLRAVDDEYLLTLYSVLCRLSNGQNRFSFDNECFELTFDETSQTALNDIISHNSPGATTEHNTNKNELDYLLFSDALGGTSIVGAHKNHLTAHGTSGAGKKDLDFYLFSNVGGVPGNGQESPQKNEYTNTPVHLISDDGGFGDNNGGLLRLDDPAMSQNAISYVPKDSGKVQIWNRLENSLLSVYSGTSAKKRELLKQRVVNLLNEGYMESGLPQFYGITRFEFENVLKKFLSAHPILTWNDGIPDGKKTALLLLIYEFFLVFGDREVTINRTDDPFNMHWTDIVCHSNEKGIDELKEFFGCEIFLLQEQHIRIPGNHKNDNQSLHISNVTFGRGTSPSQNASQQVQQSSQSQTESDEYSRLLFGEAPPEPTFVEQENEIENYINSLRVDTLRKSGAIRMEEHY